MDPTSNNLLGEVIDEFLGRFRQGECPSVAEYVQRYPELASRIKELVPMLAVMEQVGSSDDDSQASESVDERPDAESLSRLEQEAGYRIVRQIGKGGMGVVYEAVQLTLGRHVALKVIPACFASDPNRMDRFQCEAKAAAQLHHTNIVPVFEVGKAGGVGFYAMQFILGQSLDRVLAELRELRRATERRDGEESHAENLSQQIAHSLWGGSLASTEPQRDATEKVSATGPDKDTQPELKLENTEPVSVFDSAESVSTASLTGRLSFHRRVAELGVQAAAALDYAHHKGILHRDIKPGNLLLDTQGQVWITDFGLAKMEDHDLTREGDVVGTLRYMAPERFSGHADRRSDVYSLGLTLWEMLALRPAFAESDRLKLIQIVAHQSPPPIRQLEPSVPKDLETILRKATDRDPDRRYASAQDLAEDLQRFIDCKPILARRTALAERSWRWCQRNPVVAGLVAAVILVTCVGILGVVYEWRQAVEHEKIASLNASAARQSSREAIAQRDEAQEANRDLLAALERLRQVSYAAQINLAAAYWEQGAFDRIDSLLDAQLPGPGQSDLRGWEWHYLDRLRSSSAGVLTGFDDSVVNVAYDPSGQRLAASSLDRQVTIWEVDSKRLLGTIQIKDSSHVFQVVFDPLGRWIVTVDDSGAVNLWDSQSYEHLRKVTQHDGQATGVAVSPDGRYLASVSYQRQGTGECRVLDLESNRLVLKAPGARGQGRCVGFSRDGTAVMWIDKEGNLQRCKLDDPNTIEQVPLPTPIYGFTTLPSNRAAIFGQNTRLYLLDWTTGEVIRQLDGGRGFPFDLAANQDGTQLVVVGPSVRLWDLAKGELAAELPQQESRAIAFHPTENRIAIGSGNRLVRFWKSKPSAVRKEIRASQLPILEPGFAGANLELLANMSGRQINRVDMESGVVLDPLVSGETMLAGMTVSADGRWAAAKTFNRQVTIWDARTGSVIAEITAPQALAGKMALSPQGDRLAIAFASSEVGVWAIQTNGSVELLEKVDLDQGQIVAMAYSSDGRWLAVGTTSGDVVVFDTHHEMSLNRWHAHDKEITDLAFEPVTDRLATASTDRTFAVWDLNREQPLTRTASHAQAVEKLCFHPRGSRLATLGREGVIKIWDTERFDELLALRVEAGYGTGLCFDQSGNVLVSTWSDGHVRWWSIEPGEVP